MSSFFLFFSEKEIQNKWKNIRDCYVRDVRRKSGEPVKSRGKRTREYMHAGLLAFLDTSYIGPPRKIMRSPKRRREGGYDFILDTIVKPFLDQTVEINCDWIKQETLEEKIGMILEERTVVDDDDRAFFSSLLPTIQSLEPEQKVEFRMEVLQALRQIAQKQPTPPLVPRSETTPNVADSADIFCGTSPTPSGSFFGTFGLNDAFCGTSSAKSGQAALDFVTLRDRQQECSSSSTSSSSSSLPQLTSDTQ
ncbi:unnamed protein product [Gongylonema pulchrum]|uniref:BESS domain-containing protein n=1 Tax=Gongylonema pulchrum TaxID=637853 RepID=A0A183DIB1_9BILA|nr:unnamed protein product [Gongylonema pulchrum]